MLRRTAPRIALVLLVITLAGCAITPSRRWAQARLTVNAAQDGVVELHKSGVIDDDQLFAIEVAAKTARRGLAVSEQHLPDGGGDFEAWMAIVDEALVQLVEIERGRLESE